MEQRRIKIGKDHAICFMAMIYISADKNFNGSMPDVVYSTKKGKVRYLKWEKIEYRMQSWAYFLQKDPSELRERFPGILRKLHESSLLVTQGRIKVIGGSNVLQFVR